LTGFSKRFGDVLGQAVENKLENEITTSVLPAHVACIMDGNRRHANSKLIPTALGHREGKEKLEDVMDWILDLNIKYLTVYALSTENIQTRSNEELQDLFNLYTEGLIDIAEDERIHQREVKVRVIGRRELLPSTLIDAIENAESKTANYENHTFTVCLAYGSREEILGAIKEIATDHAKGSLSLEDITIEEVSKRLYTKDLPDPDMIIRTSGEERISNFLLWQSAYSELFFIDTYWPSFTKREFLKSIFAYQRRKRRYGS
tara:strand:- start:339 stop:1121 length:783 start_codon:yes stop_codon:yes gene_type:complete